MLNIDNIDITRKYATDHEEIEAIRSYIFQLYNELNFRLQELDMLIKEQRNETNNN